MNELCILSRQNSRSNRADFSWFSCCLFLDQSPRNKRWQIPIRSYLVYHSGANLRSFSCLCENFFPSFFCRWELSDARQTLKLPSFYCALWSLVSGELCSLGFWFLSYFQHYLLPAISPSLHLQSFLDFWHHLCKGSLCTISFLCRKLPFFKPLPQGSLWHPLKEVHLMEPQDTHHWKW